MTVRPTRLQHRTSSGTANQKPNVSAHLVIDGSVGWKSASSGRITAVSLRVVASAMSV